MKSKILLVTSAVENSRLVSRKHSNQSANRVGADESAQEEYYALGLAYLHSSLEKYGNKVEGLYLNNYTEEIVFAKFKLKMEEFSPDIVGFQILTENRVSSYKLIRFLHENYPNVKIVLGGIHATLMWDQLIREFPYVSVVMGEGEITFEELIKKFEKKSNRFDSVKGIAYNKKGEPVLTPARELNYDLDSLPYPKHELFLRDGKHEIGCLLTSRGCPFKCSFCCINPLTKRKVRFRSVKNTVDEIEYMVKNFPLMKKIWIHDDTFFMDNERVIQICDEIIRREIKTEFLCSGRAKPISKEMVKKLEAANFTTVLIGLESANENILKLAGKGITKQDLLTAFNLFKDSNINLKIFLIIGLPGENYKTIEETAKFVRELQKIKYISFGDAANYLRIYPGTEVYEICKRNGILNDNFWMTNQPAPIFNLENSFEKLYDYGEILLNYTSWRRMYKLKAFRHQWTMIPFLIKYLVTTKRELLLQKMLPFRK